MSTSTDTKERFTPSAIGSQLDRILGSPKFQAADQLSRFLRFVVLETLAGRQDQIKQYTVAVKALGRDPDFNPQADPVVRMQARRLRRALDQYYETAGIHDPIRIEIPKGRYVPIFLSKEDSATYQEPAAETTLSASNVRAPRHDQPDGPSIAVLPLALLGSDAEDAYLGSGITEEIVIALTRFPEFVVVGPLNRDKIWREHLGPRGIGREYNVRFILDGTIRRRGQWLRVTAKLTDALSGHQLWGQTIDYDLETNSISQLEDNIVSQVTAIIADNFGIIPSTLTKESTNWGSESMADYEAILRVYHHFKVGTEESLVAANAALETILQRDPDHALAVAYLADLTASNYHLGYVDSWSIVEQAEKLGRRAIALDPKCQPAHYAMALIYFLQFERAHCLDEIKQVLWLNPNYPNYLAASSLLLSMVGDWEQGLTLIDKAFRLNPHHPGWYSFIHYMDYYRQGEYEAALTEAQRFNTPEFFWDPLINAAVLSKVGRQAEANVAVQELLDLVPDFKLRGRSVIQRVVYLDEHVDMLVEGLHKAGLELGE